uniref:VCBS repeat-containing protein n=1 Tax=Schlesneria paludicola TaxID=360056 RepID=A0A7C4QFU5_9PLAN
MGMQPTIWVCGLALAWAAAETDNRSPLADYYGFQPLEIFKLSERAGSLLAGDFNHDGRTDVVLVNNANHRLDLLLQRPAAPMHADRPLSAGANALTDHWRFEPVKLPVDELIAALAVGDFNHDGRDDLAYFVLPDELVVRYQSASGTWSETLQLRLPDILPTQWCLAAGDMNHDGADDLVVLGKRDTVLLYQQPQGGFGVPLRLMNTSDKLGLAQVADLDGDGRLDLCYVAGEAANRMLGVRLQDARGRLGPEFIFDLERPRSVTIKELDGQPGSELLTIDSRTGRLKILKVEFAPLGAGELPEQLVRYGFGAAGSAREREWALGDFDADGRQDVVVSDPDASQVLWFRQGGERGLDLALPFPSLAGADGLRPWTATGVAGQALVVHSSTEKTIGVSRWKNGRFLFPEALPIDLEPAGVEVLDVTGDGQPEIVFLARGKKGKDPEFSLWAYRRNAADTGWEAVPGYGGPTEGGGPAQGSPLSVKSAPERLWAADVTGDARPELLLLQGNKPPVVLQFVEGGALTEVTVTGALGSGSVSGQAWFPARWHDTSGLLIPQDNFVRLMTVGSEKRWQVVEQFNVSEGGAQIVGGALLQLEPGGEPELALVDSGVKKLRLYRGGHVPWKELDLGDFDFLSAAVSDLNGDGRDDLALLGGKQLAVLYSSGLSPRVRELAAFETPLEKTFLSDVAAGDVNGDGRVDLVLTDTRSHFIEILQYRPPSQLRHATYFKLFEEKSFTGGDTPVGEPREVLLADVTGDGRVDLLVLAHDRLLLYPQDPGGEPLPR